jgi:two-component system, cell cycle sensor histidine kinase and response regulator CckA
MRQQTAEDDLRDSLSMYEDLMSNIPVGVFRFTIRATGEWQFDFVNSRFCELTGLNREDVLNNYENAFRIIHPDDFPVFISLIESVEKNPAPFGWKGRIMVNGETRWVSLKSKPTVMDNGDVVWSGHCTDFTDRKATEAALAERELRFRSMFENSMDGILFTAPDGRIFMANPAACAILGRSENEICEVGRDGVLDLTDPRLPLHLEVRRRDGKVRCELNFKHKTGALIPLELTSTIFKLASDEERSVMAFRDITERIKREDALRESEQRFRNVFEQGPIGLAILDLDYRLVAVNEKLCEITGYTADELTNFTFLDITHPEDIAKDVAQAEALASGVITQYQMEKRYIKKNKEIAWVHLTGSVVRNRQGEPRYFVGMTEDITSIKKSEQEKEDLRNQLFQSQKLEALGTLVGGIAHDFNNMLQIILGYSDLLLSDKAKSEPGYDELRTIIATANGGADLVTKLLAFGQQAPIFPVNMDLNHQISQLTSLISRTLPQVVQIDLDLVDGPATIHADPNQIDQMLMNLAINASEAMPDGGMLRFRTAKKALDDEYCKAHNKLEPGNYVTLSVTDTGRGMNRETLSRIFEPFFSTKQRGSTRGTGLGLSVVQGIAHQHGGHVDCESEPGKGTEFKVYFPAIEEPLADVKSVVPTVQSGGTETILVVEDNIPVVDLEQRFLAGAGYTVIVAANGREALDIYRSRKEEISLVVLDLLMPEMSGRDCLMELLKIDPSVKVLIASGYAPEDELHKEIRPLVRGFLQKPFAMAELVKDVRAGLDSDPS